MSTAVSAGPAAAEDDWRRVLAPAGEEAVLHEVVGVVRRDGRAAADAVARSLATAWQAGARVTSVWHRAAHGPFRVWVGGTRGFPAARADARGHHVQWPPGTRSCGAAPLAAVVAAADQPCWVRVGAVVDVERPRAEDGPGRGDAEPLLEEALGHLVDHAATVVVVGVPLGDDAVEAEVASAAEALDASARGERRAGADLLGAVARAQLAERTAARASGLWRVHVLVGAQDEAALRRVAGLWAAAASGAGAGVRYLAAPTGPTGRLPDVLASPVDAASAHAPASPFVAGTPALAALCRPPVVEVPGVEVRAANPFDVAWPAAVRGPSLPLGAVVDASGSPVGDLEVPFGELARHTFVHGSTGAGKSRTVRHLLTELTRRGVPWTVLEPAKAEYATGMAARLAAAGDLPDESLRAVHVVRPGDAGATPVSINPLEPEPGHLQQAHLDVAVDVMVAAFDAESPFPEVLVQAADRCVREAGWEPGLSEPAGPWARDGVVHAHPGVEELVAACHRVVDEKGYGREVASNVHGFVDMRLGALTTGTRRAAFSSGYPLDLRQVLRRNVVLELQDLGADADRALFMGLFLARLAEAVRVRHRDDPRPGELRGVVVVEEAHRLLRDPARLSPAAARAVGAFTDLLAEVRAYGVGLVVAEQVPTSLAPEVVKNTAVKISGRTPAADDREVVGRATGMDEEQSAHVVSLPPGRFAVHTSSCDAPVLVDVPLAPEEGGPPPADPAPLVGPLPAWYGPVRAPGALRQRDVARGAQVAAEPLLGLLVDTWTVAALTGLVPPRLVPAAREALVAGWRGAAGEAAVAGLAWSCVRARRSVLGAAPPEEVATGVAAGVLAGLRGEPAAPVPARWASRAWAHGVAAKVLRPADGTTAEALSAAARGPWLEEVLGLRPDEPARAEWERLAATSTYAADSAWRVLAGVPADRGPLVSAATALGRTPVQALAHLARRVEDPAAVDRLGVERAAADPTRRPARPAADAGAAVGRRAARTASPAAAAAGGGGPQEGQGR